MFARRSSAIEFAALTFLAFSLPFYVESVTLQGRLRNYAYNTKCLHAVGGDNGAELEIVDCSDASTIIEASGFKSMDSEAGYIQMEASSKCLSLNGFAADNGVHILIWDCVGQDNQKWSIVNGNLAGSFQLQLKETGRCLTAENGGTYVDQWDCGGDASPHQSWTLDVISQPPQVENFKGRLRNYAINSKCLNAVGGENGAELNIVDCSDSNQALIIRADKFYNMASEAAFIQFDVSQKCVSLNGFSVDNGVHLLLWDCAGQDNQRFIIQNGQLETQFQLKLKETGKCLTSENDGTYIDQWECGTPADSPHQSWTLDVVQDVEPPHELQPAQQDSLPPPSLKGLLRNYAYNTKCLHAVGGDNGAGLEIVDCSQSNLDQVVRTDSFFEMRYSPGYIQFDQSEKCLSLNGFAGDNGVKILIWDCVGQDNQRFSIVNGQLGGPFQLKMQETGKCVTAENGGTYIDQWDCGADASPHQSWILDIIDMFEPGVPPQIDLNYKGILRNYAYNTKCLHAVGGDNGAELEIVDCSAANQDQLLRMDSFQNMEHEAGYVQFDASGKCLSLNGFAADNGVHILTWDCVDQDNQKWRMVNNGDGHAFQLQLKSTGKCLTAENGGAYVDQWDCATSIDLGPHQSWTVDKVPLDSNVAQYTFYLLENYDKPNYCLRYKDGSASNYDTELAPCNSYDMSQRLIAYTEYADALGFSGIQFVATGNCLDVSGESNTNGASVGQWSCVNQANQRWRMENFKDDGAFRIRTEIGERCLTSEYDGKSVDIWECGSPAPHQYWKHRNPNEGRTAQKLQVLQNYKYPDKCLHTVATSQENGAQLELINCDAIKPEESMNTNEWMNYDTTAGYVKFNGKCLSMDGFGSDNGVRLVQWDCVDQANQRWQIVNGDIDTNFQLKSEQSGKCLTAENEGGTYMDQWDCSSRDEGPHQSWMIKTIGGSQHDDLGLGEPESFFEPAGAILQMVEHPGKCLSISGVTNENEVVLADCDQFDANQLFDHSDLLNLNANPGLLKLLGTDKCLTVSSNNHVTQTNCDISNLNEMWFIILGNLFGTFKLKTSQSTKCITPENGGTYTDITDCDIVVSDSRKRRDLETLSRNQRDLNSRGMVRMSYKMSQPNNNQLYLIRSAYYSGYCLASHGSNSWSESDVGIEACNKDDESQLWHFEQIGPAFENRFYVKNAARCLWSKGKAVGKPIDYQNACIESNTYIFTFQTAGSNNAYSGLCMQVKWYHDDARGKYVDYVEQQPCGLVGWSSWMAMPLNPYRDHDCGPRFGGKFCTGAYTGNCCSIYGGCGTTTSYCARLKCDPRHGPCINTVDSSSNLDYRCGPWAATLPNHNGRCRGRYAGPGYCCGSYGVCGKEAEHCLLDNCDPEYGNCPPDDKGRYPNKCGPLWGNKPCTGRAAEQCCSKVDKYFGECGTSSEHCRGPNCDPKFGMCYGQEVCLWAGNSKVRCKAGDCCSKQGKCGTTEAFCGWNCDIQLSCGTRCHGGLTTTAVGLYPEQFGTCRTTSCGPEGTPCTVTGKCCDNLRCVADPDNSTEKMKAKKCVV